MSSSKEADYFGSNHTVQFLKPERLAVYVKAATKVLKSLPDEYDTLVFSGISGAIIGPVVAMKVKKETILVRKEKDVRRSPYDVAGYKHCKNYIIIDDFIDYGNTVRRIQKQMYAYEPNAKCVGVLSVQELEGTGSCYHRDGLIKTYNLTEKELKG